MEMSMERDSSALGSLFQQIINDMKNTSPLWEDFVAKASKLHACLRAAIQAIAAYLDAFQKIADAATNSRGASKEIGTALTRVCLRHKAVETRLKTFTAAIMDCLVQPLQDKLEDWKRSVATIDKEHAKEYKRCRTELKKRSTDTLRLQKKARKGQSDTLQSLMDSHMQDVTLRRAELEEVEKKSLRSAMIEERMRYCSFVYLLQPVVKEECEVMSELGHLQEAMQSIALVTKEPQVLPAASEELIHDAKASIILYPESPSASAGGGGSLSQGGCSNSLGSRKSSVCSISSMNSSGSSNSPGHPHYPRSLSQLISPSIRLKPGESSDSGFCSSPALTTQASSINNPSHAVTTWPTHSQDAVDLPSNASERPHTISSTYEKGHQRPPLTVYTFQNPETIHEGGTNAVVNNGGGSSSGQNTPATQKSPAGALTRPPLPVKPTNVRCSSLERPLAANNNRGGNGSNIMQRQCPSPIPAHVTKELSAHLAQQQHQQQQQQQQLQQTQQQTSPPTYVNMSELANMAAMKLHSQQLMQQQQQQQLQQQQQSSPPTQQHILQQQHSIDSISSIHSNDSAGASMHQHNQQSPYQQQQQQQQQVQTPPSHQQQQQHTPRSHSSNSNTPSLHSHPSIDSTVATPPIAQTPSFSSGSSTPQNHYSPLLTNSPSSTAAGTPSGASITSSGLTTSGGAVGNNSSGNNFLYNVCSPTPPQSANSSQASDILKITETEAAQPQPPPPPALPHQPTLNNESNACPSSTSSSPNNVQEISNSYTDIDSTAGIVVENDERSRASVLQKASMFEKQAAAVKSTPTVAPALASAVSAARNSPACQDTGIYGTRTNNHHHQQHQQQAQQSQTIDPQEVDKCFEDSLQELNNLIGELDSFQREIDATKQQKEHQKNVKNLYDGIDSYISNETMTIITDDTSTTIICETTQEKHLQHLQQHQDKDFCAASNQTNSSGCGTDISDTTSEDCNADSRSLTSQTGQGLGLGKESGLLNTNLKAFSGGQYNSDSELSRCYISETSSIMGGGGGGGDGYENPTFAHFANNSSSASQCYDDNRSDTLSLQRQPLYADNMSDNGSNVVVIYDHQPPITPDMDYVKQNSEIVMLRTKPQQQQSPYQQEMRELKQLPDNLTETSPTSPDGSNDHLMHHHTATVAPAKQRLSSFRASSEQLQLLNASPGATKGMHNSSSTGPLINNFHNGDNVNVAAATMSSPATNSLNSCNDTIISRKKLPPKPPSLTVFQALPSNQKAADQSNRKSLKLTQPPMKLDFKSDLEAKLLKQKEKLKKQQEQELELELQQQQQQKQILASSPTTTSTATTPSNNHQHHHDHNSNNSINCNSSSSLNNKTKTMESSSLSTTTTSSSSPSSLSSASHSNNINHTSLSSSTSLTNHDLNGHHHHHHTQLNTINMNGHSNTHNYSKTPLTAHGNKSSAFSSSSSASSSSSSSLNVVTPPLPPPLPPTNGSMLCHSSPAPSNMLANVAKPSITPRPASLSGTTRIARRSSVNTAKPPPPVRRSSSVTPSPNTPTTPTNPNATSSMLHQQAHSLNTSTENLPPPPAYLLDARQATSPPAGMPNSSQKVSETMKALSGLRHQTASPHTLRRLQQQQQQQQQQQHQQQLQQMTSSPPTALTTQQQSMLQSPIHHYHHHNIYSPTITTPTSPITLPMHDEPEYDAYYNTYVEVQSFAARNALTTTPTKNNANVALMLNNHNKIISPLYQQPPKQYQHQHQYTKSSPVMLSPTSAKRSTPTPPTPLSPQSSSLQHDLDDIPPPLPPPNPNHHNHHQHQLSLPLRYQQQLPIPTMPAISNNNHVSSSSPSPPQQQHHNQQQQELLQQQEYYDNGEAIYGTNSPTSFRTSSPGGIYAQPKILNNMSSFRTNSHGPNGHQTPTQSHVPAQPKTNPNLIAQLNARLSSKPPTSTNEAIYGVSPNHHPHPHHHQQHQQQQQQQQQQKEEIYMRNYQQQQQQQQMSPHASQQQLQQQTYDGKFFDNSKSKLYGSFSTSSSLQSSQTSTLSSTTPPSSSVVTSTHTSKDTQLTATSTASFNSLPHFPLSSSTSSLLSKVTSFSKDTPPTKVGSGYASKPIHNYTTHSSTSTSSHSPATAVNSINSSTTTSHYHPSLNMQNAAAETNANAANFTTNQNIYSSQYYAPKTLTAAHQQHPPQAMANVLNQQQRQATAPMCLSPMPPQQHQQQAVQQSHYQSGVGYHPHREAQQQHYTCPPPLEDPPPPPVHNNNTATMPAKRSIHHHQAQPASNLATYAAASTASTLPKNIMQQQRLQQQQQQQQLQQQALYGNHQAQQQQYHAPAAISGSHQQAQQHQNPQHISQRPPMPLPHHQQQLPQQQQHQNHPQNTQQQPAAGNRQKTTMVNIKQPPVPSRHSSVQQKIFVATNPFIQTTTIHCHSPSASSVHSQPASPICNSPTPSSVASIYGTSSRRSSGSGGGMGHYDVGGNGGSLYYNHQPNSSATNTNYSSTNVDKTGSIRTKTKAEFLENLNAKLAKQSLSGRAFAVRNLINSKALPDPRICHESLMDQIKRGATLKRNQKINDRSAPKNLLNNN